VSAITGKGCKTVSAAGIGTCFTGFLNAVQLSTERLAAAKRKLRRNIDCMRLFERAKCVKKLKKRRHFCKGFFPYLCELL